MIKDESRVFNYPKHCRSASWTHSECNTEWGGLSQNNNNSTEFWFHLCWSVLMCYPSAQTHCCANQYNCAILVGSCCGPNLFLFRVVISISALELRRAVCKIRNVCKWVLCILAVPAACALGVRNECGIKFGYLFNETMQIVIVTWKRMEATIDVAAQKRVPHASSSAAPRCKILRWNYCERKKIEFRLFLLSFRAVRRAKRCEIRMERNEKKRRNVPAERKR